ncbi:MAG: TonB-dependent receptor, partial [Bacteroidetes bacterium]
MKHNYKRKQNYLATRNLTLLTLLLLFSTSLAAQQGTVRGVVTDEDGPVIGATVKVEGSGLGTTSDLDGNYELLLEPGEYVLEASYVGSANVRISITIVAGTDYLVDFQLSKGIYVDEVVVIGSRGKPRTQLETAVPVDVIGAKQIRASSQVNVTGMLQLVAPSFHSTPQTISDGTDHIDPATLRGLGPDQVLVLVNGKRRHTSSLVNVNGTVGRGTVGTDLNAIPKSAIKRIEILRDGAAAQYGSDAIAGVINIVLKDDVNQASVDFQAGFASPNTFDGPGNSAGNVPEELIPTFNSDGATYAIGTNFGFDLGKNGGFVNVTAEYMDRQSTNRSGNYTGSIYPDGYENAMSRDEFFAQVREETGFAENQVMEIGNSKLRDMGAFLNASLPLNSSGAELYGTLGWNYRDGLSRGFYRFPSQQVKVVPQVLPQGFSPQINSAITDNSFIIGARGDINGWHADLSQTRGSNRFDFTIKNSLNASLGAVSPRQAYAGGFEYSQNTTNLDFNRRFEGNIPINVAFGGEMRFENYQIEAGEPTSYVNGGVENVWIIDGDTTLVAGAAGIQVFPGFQPQNALTKDRNSFAAYGDLEFDFTDAFLVTVAGRYENFSDFGDNFSFKLAARYKITDNITARSSYSTGFRAPSLQQVYFNNLSTQFVDVDGEQVAVQVGTFNNESNVTKAFGIKPLTAETSNNFSIGATAGFGRFSIAVDYYNIKIDDRIVLSGRFGPDEELANGQPAGDILTPLGAGSAQFFTNAINTTTSGVDFVA